jgi:hypothetical protein
VAHTRFLTLEQRQNVQTSRVRNGFQEIGFHLDCERFHPHLSGHSVS